MKKLSIPLLILCTTSLAYASADQYVPLELEPFIGVYHCKMYDAPFKKHSEATVKISPNPQNSETVTLNWQYPKNKLSQAIGFFYRGHLITAFQDQNSPIPGASSYISENGGKTLSGQYIYFNDQNNSPSTIECWRKNH